MAEECCGADVEFHHAVREEVLSHLGDLGAVVEFGAFFDGVDGFLEEDGVGCGGHDDGFVGFRDESAVVLKEDEGTHVAECFLGFGGHFESDGIVVDASAEFLKGILFIECENFEFGFIRGELAGEVDAIFEGLNGLVGILGIEDGYGVEKRRDAARMWGVDRGLGLVA